MRPTHVLFNVGLIIILISLHMRFKEIEYKLDTLANSQEKVFVP